MQLPLLAISIPSFVSLQWTHRFFPIKIHSNLTGFLSSGKIIVLYLFCIPKEWLDPYSSLLCHLPSFNLFLECPTKLVINICVQMWLYWPSFNMFIFFIFHHSSSFQVHVYWISLSFLSELSFLSLYVYFMPTLLTGRSVILLKIYR